MELMIASSCEVLGKPLEHPQHRINICSVVRRTLGYTRAATVQVQTWRVIDYRACSGAGSDAAHSCSLIRSKVAACLQPTIGSLVFNVQARMAL